MTDVGSRLALWSVLVLAGVFVMGLMAACGIADVLLRKRGQAAI